MKRLFTALVLCLATHVSLLAQGEYAMPAVPDSISQPAERAAYAALRYWERFDFGDTLQAKGSYGEQALANFLGLLAYAPAEAREQSLSRWVTLAARNAVVLSYAADRAYDYLHEKDSPLRNDSLCVFLLRKLSEATSADEATRSRAAFRLQQLTANQPGQVAADFLYVRPDGTASRLHAASADRHLLLLFYDPACDDCQSLLFRLRHHTLLRRLVAEGRLAVLAVCTETGEDDWRQSLGELPEGWMPAYADASAQSSLPYDLESLPTLFLLDGSHRVVLKQPNNQQLTQYLLSLSH